MKAPKEPSIEMVLWQDADTPMVRWHSIDRLRRSAHTTRCLTVGIVLGENKDHLLMGATINDARAAGEVIRIPIRCILGRKRMLKLTPDFAAIVAKGKP